MIAFNITVSSDDLNFFKTSASIQNGSTSFKECLKRIINQTTVDGTVLINSAFSLEDVDIFISYSHKDSNLASKLANILREECDLKVFLDCDSWEYSDTLLEELDKKYCKSTKEGNYDYSKRNITTAHIHAMLSISLLRQLEKSKYVFFLNTKNSNKYNASMTKATIMSPWIYEEIEFVKLLKRKEGLTEHCAVRDISIEYNTSLNDFRKMTVSNLHNMINECKGSREKAIAYLERIGR